MSAQHFAPFWIFFLPLFEPLKPHIHSNTAIVYVTTHFRNCIPQQLSCTDTSYRVAIVQQSREQLTNRRTSLETLAAYQYYQYCPLPFTSALYQTTYDYNGQFLTAYFQRCIGLPSVEMILFQRRIPRNVILH